MVAEIRPAKEEDFFMFCPEVIDGDVLVITDVGCHTPEDLNIIFRDISTSAGRYLQFHW